MLAKALVPWSIVGVIWATAIAKVAIHQTEDVPVRWRRAQVLAAWMRPCARVGTPSPPTTAAGKHTEKQHLDFVPLHHPILLQLVLDFLIAGLSLLVLCRHAAAHVAGG